MKNIISAFISVFILTPAISALAKAPIIYGEDDRQDYAEASATKQKIADSVVSIWDKAYVERHGAGYKLITLTLEKAEDVCPTEKYSQQLTGARCSGSLVGEDLVLTAGHCYSGMNDCKNSKIVFGFNESALKNAASNSSSQIPEENVYSCADVVQRSLGIKNDYALIKLDRKVTGRKPLDIERIAPVKAGDAVFTIGHPLGGTLKIAGNAHVRSVLQTKFITDLDTFRGNSGSAVFSEKTNKIIGIVTRGGEDFVYKNKNCKEYNKIEQDAGDGETVNMITPLMANIPDINANKTTVNNAAINSALIPASKTVNKFNEKKLKNIGFN